MTVCVWAFYSSTSTTGCAFTSVIIIHIMESQNSICLLLALRELLITFPGLHTLLIAGIHHFVVICWLVVRSMRWLRDSASIEGSCHQCLFCRLWLFPYTHTHIHTYRMQDLEAHSKTCSSPQSSPARGRSKKVSAPRYVYTLSTCNIKTEEILCDENIFTHFLLPAPVLVPLLLPSSMEWGLTTSLSV